ncbi:MAG: NAD-dependent epimerase/dehydratase family protein [Anaerolineales bacterium]|nr:NAD-dependent epimerase/dehydratase family protein [Anaerolineales bacterium]
MKVFITGSTGFIGGWVVRKLLARGDEVFALVRSEQAAAVLAEMGAHPVMGDITESESMRSAMQGCDLVFHIAAWYKLGSHDQALAKKINVEGTRIVLNLAHELKIPKIVYTSTIAVLGDTHGKIVDETYHMPAEQAFITNYDRTKWQAHYDVALPLIAQGAPIIIVMPGAVYGPGDHSLVGQLMQAYYRGWLPLFPGPDTMLTFVHVDDIAEGHLLAAEKGQLGESYILAGPALSFRQFINLCASASGKHPPLAYIHSRFLRILLPLSEFLSRSLPWPEMLSPDAVRVIGATYIASADKARRVLGWQPRPIKQRLSETFAWMATSQSTTPGQPAISLSTAQSKMIAAAAIGAALGLLVVWVLGRMRRKSTHQDGLVG